MVCSKVFSGLHPLARPHSNFDHQCPRRPSPPLRRLQKFVLMMMILLMMVSMSMMEIMMMMLMMMMMSMMTVSLSAFSFSFFLQKLVMIMIKTIMMMNFKIILTIMMIMTNVGLLFCLPSLVIYDIESCFVLVLKKLFSLSRIWYLIYLSGVRLSFDQNIFTENHCCLSDNARQVSDFAVSVSRFSSFPIVYISGYF